TTMLRACRYLCVYRSALFGSLRHLLCAVLSCSLIFSPMLSMTSVRAEAPGAKPPTQSPKALIPQVITQPHKAGELLVKFRADAPSLARNQIIDAYGKGHKDLRGRSGASKLTIKDNLDLSATLFDLKQLSGVVEWAEPNFI